MNGTVKWFDNKKGYGFVLADGKEWFFHHSEIVSATPFKTATAGDLVEFSPSQNDLGPRATKVRRILVS